MNNISQFVTSEGAVISSNVVSQNASCYASNVYTSDCFNYRSTLDYNFNTLNRFAIDSCWETGNIIRIDGTSIIKETFEKQALYTETLPSPQSLSIQQKRINIPQDPSLWENEIGCWIVDNINERVYFLDPTLTSIRDGATEANPVRVVATMDGGCFVFCDGSQMVMRFDPLLNLLGTTPYASLFAFPSATSLDNIVADVNGNLWYLIRNIVTKAIFVNGLYTTKITIDPISDMGIVNLDAQARDIDIDKVNNPNRLFVIGIMGCRSGQGAWLAEYNDSGVLLQGTTDLDMNYPTMIKVQQNVSNQCLYVVTETDRAYIPYCSSSSSSSESSSSSPGYGDAIWTTTVALGASHIPKPPAFWIELTPYNSITNGNRGIELDGDGVYRYHVFHNGSYDVSIQGHATGGTDAGISILIAVYNALGNIIYQEGDGVNGGGLYPINTDLSFSNTYPLVSGDKIAFRITYSGSDGGDQDFVYISNGASITITPP